jgi:hypothetical protein
VTSPSTKTPVPRDALGRAPDLFAYAERGFDEVQGWCDPRTLSVLAELAELQAEAGVAGGSAEIGVYHGKLLIALHLLRSPGARTLAIDLFEHQDLNLDRSGEGDSGQVRRNLEANCRDTDQVELMARDSLDLADDDVLAILERHGRFRWFSVDGGHTVDHAVNDLRLAERLIVAGGIVVVDDYYNQDWPGVHEAVARRFILDDPRIVPFLVGFGKLYLTTIAHHDDYFGGIGERLRSAGHRLKMVSMYGHYVLSVRPAS